MLKMGLAALLLCTTVWGWSNKPELETCGSLLSTRLTSLRPPLQQSAMGVLERVKDWDPYEKALGVVSVAGDHAITTDLSWGWIEPEEGKFDWSYYKDYLQRVKKAGLKWVPIFSFHSIGGNVGDNVNVPIPEWVWSKSRDMQFEDRFGRKSNEYIHFLVPEAYEYYERFMESFREAFWDEREHIAKIYVGMGPAGELRYPSYASSMGWSYPQIGEFQTFGPRFGEFFKNFLSARYGTIDALNSAWGIHATSFDDGFSAPRDGEHFFRSARGSAYQRDYFDAQQLVMENHLLEMTHRMRRVFLPFGEFTEAEKHLMENERKGLIPTFYGPNALKPGHRPHFKKELSHTHAQAYWKLKSLEWRKRNPSPRRPDFLGVDGSIGVKGAGIHWLHSHPEYPRAAAQAAGYDDYASIMGLLRILGATFTFTCMEMGDDADPTPGSFSKPRSLFSEIARLASLMDLPLYGENALAMGGNLQAFKNLAQVIQQEEVHGFTFLRIGDLANPDGSPKPAAELYRQYVSGKRRTRFFFPGIRATALPPGIEMRLLANDPGVMADPVHRSVKMDPTLDGIWVTDLEINDPSRLSWKVILADTQNRSAIAQTNWMPPETLTTYVWMESGIETQVVRLPDFSFFAE